MEINIITNINNGVGLQRDYELLRDLLQSWGHVVNGVHFQNPICRKVDRNIFIETINPDIFQYAPEQWLIPNVEWFTAGWTQYLHRPDFKRILCKTWDALRLMNASMNGSQAKLKYTGFMARDFYDPTVQRQGIFLHVAGKSQTKNTQAIIDAWKNYPIREKLLIVSEYFTGHHQNIQFVRRLTEEQLRAAMNQCQLHLCPSGYEGYGQALHEALGCGGIVITTNEPPMNEFGTPKELLVASARHMKYNLAPLHGVCAQEIYRAVRSAMRMTPEQVAAESLNARTTFLRQNEEFKAVLKELM